MTADPPPGLWIAANGTRALAATTQRWVTVPQTVRSCGTPIHLTVAVHYSPWRPLIRGLQQCRNRFVCPYCSWHLRVVLTRRWNHILTALFDIGEPLALMTLSLPAGPDEHLDAVLSDLMAAWKRFRSLDTIEHFGSSSFIYAWALGVTVGDRDGPRPRLNCFTQPTPSWDRAPDYTANRVTDLWRQAAHATSGRSVPTTHVTYNYLTPESVPSAVGYALGLGPHPDLYPDTTTHGDTLLELALRAHLHNDRKAGRLLADTARRLTRRKSHQESARWKDTARFANAVALDANSIYETIYSPDPEPVCVIRSSDYTRHKPAIDHWCDTTKNLSRPDFYQSLRQLIIDQCRIHPARLTPPPEPDPPA